MHSVLLLSTRVKLRSVDKNANKYITLPSKRAYSLNGLLATAGNSSKASVRADFTVCLLSQMDVKSFLGNKSPSSFSGKNVIEVSNSLPCHVCLGGFFTVQNNVSHQIGRNVNCGVTCYTMCFCKTFSFIYLCKWNTHKFFLMIFLLISIAK